MSSPLQRFCTLMALFSGTMSVFCTVRVFACERDAIGYVPLVLGACTVLTLAAAMQAGRQKTKEK